MTPTQRTLAYYRTLGYRVDVVERYQPHSHRRLDLFGMIDILAIRPGEIVGIQATSGDNHADRCKKLIGHENARAWLESGAKLVVVSWKKYASKVDGKLWRCRVEPITLDRLAG